MKRTLLVFFFAIGLGYLGWGQTPYVMSGGDYSETFTNIANTTNWPNGFNGTDCVEWTPVAINASGTIGDGVKITVSTATFSTSSSGGVQRGSANIYMLSTSTANSCAIDLLLDFTGRNAGTISFDVATVFNSTGNRDSKLRLFYSTDGTTFTEITGTNLPYTARNNVAGSASITTISLPIALNNSSTARLRFYEHSTTLGGLPSPTGSQPKISIDNIAVTSSASGNTAPTLTTQAVTSIATTTATGNGNITATGGIDPTTRGFCWDLAANPDPDINDFKVEETGDFSTGTFTGSITGLTPGTQYKVRAFATNTINTGYGSVVTFYTQSTEPTSHPATFTASSASQTQIDLAFSAASTIPASGYLILQKTGSAPTGAPSDATSYSEGNAIGDGTVAAIITVASEITRSITGLTAGTHYYFNLFPYNWDGANASTYNYKTDATVPTADATTAVANSTASDIITDETFTYPSNISYQNYQETDLTSSSLEIARFTIRDGGATIDVDALETLLTAITFSITNSSNLRRVALYDGTTEISEVASGASISFSSLSLSASDGGTKNFSLRASFNSTVTDNQQFQFTVTSATADATKSVFAAANAGGAVSSVANDDNRIEVTATKLLFIQQPTSTAPNATMTPAVTVASADANDNTDLDYTTPITMTSTGTLTGSPVTGVLASGLATFSNLVHTAIGLNLTLSANSGSLSILSNAFNIQSFMLDENFSYTIGTDLTANGWNITGTTASPTVKVSASSISYPGYLSSGIGEEVTMATSGQDVNKTFGALTSGTVYASCIVNIASATSTGDYCFHLGASSISTTFHGKVFIKKDASNNVAFGISKIGAVGTAIFTPFSYALNTTYLVVLKYTIVPGVSNDVASIIINPTLNTTEPVTGWTTSTDVANDLANVGSFALRQGGSSTAPAFKIDGIRISTSWTEIVGTEQIFTGTGNWTETARWNSGSLPAVTSAATIDGSATVSSAVSVSEIKINATRSLTVANNGQLTVSGTLANNAGATGLVIESNATGTGSLLHNTTAVNATIERYITGSTNLSANMYHFVSVPLEASNNPLAGLFTGSYLSYFDQPTQSYLSAGSNASSPLDVTRGYMIYYPNTSTTYLFAGTMNNADFTANTSHYSVTIGPDTYTGFNLVPNPYPSAIDWDAASGWTRTLINDAIWIWNPTAGNYAAYAAQAGTNNGTRYIPQGQSFFVQSSNTSPVLAMNNSVRVHNTQAFYKSTETVLPELFRLHIDGIETSDEIVVRFNQEAGIENGLFDVAKLTGSESAPQLYTLTESSEKLSINALPHSTQTIIVPVGLEYNQEGQLEFVSSGFESFESSVTIFLEDKLLNKMIDLRETPAYTFTHSTGNDALRFNLHFYGVNSTPAIAAKDYNIWSTVDHLNIHIPALTGQKATVELYDLLGHLVLSRQVNLGTPTQIAVPQFNGMGIVRVIANSQVFSEKVFIR